MIVPALSLALLALPARAQSGAAFFDADPASAEARLKDWVSAIPELRRRTARRPKPKPEPGLKDAVAALPAKAPEAFSIRPLRERLPGLPAAPFASCQVLEGCGEAPLAFRVDAAGDIGEAAAALLRPWMLLQRARGRSFGVIEAPAGERLLSVRLEGLPFASLDVRLTPLSSGGWKVWLRGRPDPALVYADARADALAKPKPPEP